MMSSAAWKRINVIDDGIGSTIDPDALGIVRRLWLHIFLAIAIYNSIEVVCIVLLTFKRYRGLYFCSLIVSAAGTGFYSAAYILNFDDLVEPRLVPIIIAILSWHAMVTGQAVVLYSRMHLLFNHHSQLRPVLAMIITTAILVYIPAWVVIIGANTGDPAPHSYLIAYSLFEKIEITIFFTQEIILSGIYLVKCHSYWKTGSLRSTAEIRSMIIHLVVVNLLVVCFDISLLYLEWAGNYVIQVSFKGFIYSVKLKVELSILSNLVNLVKVARNVEFQENMSRRLEEEWTDTLDRTIGVGHKHLANERRDTPLIVPNSEMCQATLQIPEMAFPRPRFDDVYNASHPASWSHGKAGSELEDDDT